MRMKSYRTQILHTWAGFRAPVQLLLKLLPFTSISSPHIEMHELQHSPVSAHPAVHIQLFQLLSQPLHSKNQPHLGPAPQLCHLPQPGSFAVHLLVSEHSHEMVFAIS